MARLPSQNGNKEELKKGMMLVEAKSEVNVETQ